VATAKSVRQKSAQVFVEGFSVGGRTGVGGELETFKTETVRREESE